MKREGKKVNEDYFSAGKESEVRCINGKDSILVSPILEWTEKDVWEFLNDVVKVPHCELYDKGYKRIGCILCPMSSHKQKVREMNDFPHVKRNWIKAIKEIRRGGGYHKANILPQAEIRPTSVLRNVSAITNGNGTMDGTPPPTQGNGIEKQTQGFGLDSAPRQQPLDGFSDSPSLNGNRGGQNEPTEDEIAEKIFDWWISGKSYTKWYADKYLQQKINFEE